MRITRFDLCKTALPFRTAFKHARAERRDSASIFLRCELEDKTYGFGESLPREYVTGESWQSCFESLRSIILPQLIDLDFDNYEDAEAYCTNLYSYLGNRFSGLSERYGAACCAVELALLDAFGRHFRRTSFGAPGPDPIYSGVVSSSGPLATIFTSLRCRMRGLNSVKLKITPPGELAAARRTRFLLGRNASLRVDANMAWTEGEALASIPRLREFGIEYFEQPIATREHAALARIQDQTGARIIADEDLCDLRDAESLVKHNAASMFNLRISKCGGYCNSLRIGQFALAHGIQIQIGCQVGESALLSAVGLALARRLSPVTFAEGCFGEILLAEDPIDCEKSECQMPFQFGRGGTAPLYRPTVGIGIALKEELIQRHSREHFILQRQA